MDNRGVAANDGLRPWPRIRDTWWVFGLAAVALGLFLLGFLVALRCGPWGCSGSLAMRLLDLDAVGGLPRLFTTVLFLGVGFLAWRARSSVDGPPRVWWGAMSAIAVGLAVAKAVSVHATFKNSVSPVLTLVGGLLLTGLALGALWVAGERWGVAAARPVVAAMALYAVVALGLDLLTGLAAAVQDRVGWLTVSGTAFVEELGEALAALLLLVTVRWQSPAATSAGPSSPCSGLLAGAVGGDGRAAGAGVGAVPAAGVARGVDVDVVAVLGRADAEPLPAVLDHDLRQAHRDRRRQLLEHRGVGPRVVQVQFAVVVGRVGTRPGQRQQLVEPGEDVVLRVGQRDGADELGGGRRAVGLAGGEVQRGAGREPLVVGAQEGARPLGVGRSALASSMASSIALDP